MVNSIDDVARQARQGSVSAIIQVLNEQLADSGVRTRAILSDGVLQLLCEAAKPEQLEQVTLVDRIRQILESIQPRYIRRININSRIVREQQVLWLEEINRDPKHQLLWSQEITLTQSNVFKRLLEDLLDEQQTSARALRKAVRESKEHRQFWRGIIGGVSFSLLLLIAGWIASDRFGVRFWPSIQAGTTTSALKPSLTSPPSASAAPDPFVQAVRLAERAVQDGQQAKTRADWLDLASRWQRAADLMSQVLPTDERYQTARDRLQLYGNYSKAAQVKAEQQRQQELGQLGTKSPAANLSSKGDRPKSTP
jgi:hypothetical protein